VWIVLIFIVILGLLLAKTSFGRYVVASGGNAEAARLAGVRVNQIRIITFALSGLAAGLGGVIDTSRLLSAQSTGGGPNLTFTVLAASSSVERQLRVAKVQCRARRSVSSSSR